MKIQNGHGLIELMISLLLFSLGLLALLDFDCANFRQENNALLRAYAINQLQEAETLLQSSAPQEGLWDTHNQHYLPQGKGKISHSKEGDTINLTWEPLKIPGRKNKEALQLQVVEKITGDE